jgi:integration host factor subunit alpha
MATRRAPQPALTKAEIVRSVQGQVGVTGAQAGVLVEHVFEAIKEVLTDPEHGEVKITGFGTFHVRRKAARLGRNPRTMEDVVINERNVLRFRCSQLLRSAMNKESR